MSSNINKTLIQPKSTQDVEEINKAITTSKPTQQVEEINKIIKNNFINMDENNKAAATIMLEKGSDKAVEFMMSSAGMDYSRMRSMYG